MSYLFSFSRNQTKCVIKFLFRQHYDVTNLNIYLGSSSKAMAGWEKEGKIEVKTFEYFESKKSFLDEIENIFHKF